jgi:hypothetical protein
MMANGFLLVDLMSIKRQTPPVENTGRRTATALDIGDAPPNMGSLHSIIPFLICSCIILVIIW